MRKRRNPRVSKKTWNAVYLGAGAIAAVVLAPKLGIHLPNLSGILSPGGSHPSVNGPFSDLNTLLAANPNIASQATEWASERRSKGQDPLDWNAFRVHVQAIGGPDPGSLPFAAFFPIATVS